MKKCTPDEIEVEILLNFRTLDETERLIFLRVLGAAVAGRIKPDQMFERGRALTARYRAGEEITIADLNAIGTP